MKLKAPPGVGDPCVAGLAIVSRDGIYEVEPETGALLIEAFGFVETKAEARGQAAPARANVAAAAPSAPRQGPPFPKLTHPAWRTKPASKQP
jgi:hypothetical protein